MSDTQAKVILGAAAAIGAIGAIGSLAYLYSRKPEEPIPTKWKKVGQITDLNLFPIKSCGVIKRDSFYCHPLGLESGNFHDRSFLVVTQKGKQVTARGYPKMVLIHPKIDVDSPSKLILTAPNKPDIVIDLNDLKGKKARKVTQWEDKSVIAIDAGDDVAQWISEFVNGTKDAFRLVYYPLSYPTKPILNAVKIYKQLTSDDIGAYHDATSYMMINQASIDDLNSRLDHIIKPLQFRPNLVMKGPAAFEEDNFKWVRVSNGSDENDNNKLRSGDVVFRNVKPCTRCIFTCINPETAERHPNREPLETLIKYRSIIANESPVMGLHLGVRLPGYVSIGDSIYIDDEEA